MPRHKIKKTVLITGYSCNNNCKFCVDADKRRLPEKSTQQIISEMLEAKRAGRTYLELIGGEPTIRPDCLLLVETAKKIKFRTILMATNGKMLAYPDFAKKLVRAGVTSIIFSIHGHNARLHDSLTRSAGSFKQLLKGVKNVRNAGLTNIGSNTTIVKQNFRSLPKIAEVLLGVGIRNSEFIFVDPTHGGPKHDFKGLVPRISEAAPYIKTCLDIGKKHKANHWHIRYVPLCHFVGYEAQVSELREKRYFQTAHIAPDFRNLDVENSRAEFARIKNGSCATCRYFKRCEGIWKEYAAHYGTDELRPLS